MLRSGTHPSPCFPKSGGILSPRLRDSLPAARDQRMSDPYDDLSQTEREVVVVIAKAIGNGYVGPHNRVSPRAARRVFDEMRRKGWMSLPSATSGNGPSAVRSR